MAADNLDSADLKAVAYGGLVNEDVMQQIWDISWIPLPFTDDVGAPGSSDNSYKEWTTDRLQDPNLSNAKVDGADTIGDDDTNTGARVGNHHQISTKTVKVSTRARESDTVGSADEFARQLMMRQRELRRDVEAIALHIQASQADDGNTTPGLSGSFASWLTSNVDVGTGTPGGFSNGVVAAYTPGSGRPGTEAMLKQVVEDIYIGGGDPTRIMSVAGVIRGLNEWMFDNSAKIATLDSDAGQSRSQMVAKGSVNVYIADHGQVLLFVPNRIQQTYMDNDGAPAPAAIVYIYDPEYVGYSFLHGYRTEALSKTGLADNSQIIVDWTLVVNNEEAHGMLADIDPAQAWTAS